MVPEMYLVRISREELPDRALLELISVEQRSRFERLHRASQYPSLCGWLLARVLCCEKLGAENHTLHFGTIGNGKPVLDGYPDFAFNISHTKGAVAAAVADRPVGVDVEQVRPVRTAIANRFFTKRERDYVFERDDPGEVQRRFFLVWTRKESWIKRSGKGLSTPLSSFDTIGGKAAGHLFTRQQQSCILSVCCEHESAKTTFREVSEEQLFAAARQLSACS